MKQNITLSLRKFATRTLLAAALAWITPLATQGQILNPDFESGTSSWIETGGFGNFTAPTSVAGLYQTVNPVHGTRLGLISNDGVATETISQTFTLSAGLNYLTFSYRFLTDEYNDPFANDAAAGSLTPAVGSPLTLFNVSRNDLQAGGAGPLLPGAVYFDIQTIAQSGWKTVTADLSAFAGQTVTLAFNVDNGGDPDLLLGSRLAIDNLSISAVPEPGAPVLLGLGLLALLGVQRVRRAKTLAHIKSKGANAEA